MIASTNFAPLFSNFVPSLTSEHFLHYVQCTWLAAIIANLHLHLHLFLELHMHSDLFLYFVHLFFFICLCCFCFWWITNFSNRTKKLFSWFWKTNADEIFHQDIRASRRALHVKVCDQCNSFWLSPDLGQPSPDLDVAAGWSTMYCWSRLALGPPDQSLKGAVTSNFSPGPKNKLPN